MRNTAEQVEALLALIHNPQIEEHLHTLNEEDLNLLLELLGEEP